MATKSRCPYFAVSTFLFPSFQFHGGDANLTHLGDLTQSRLAQSRLAHLLSAADKTHQQLGEDGDSGRRRGWTGWPSGSLFASFPWQLELLIDWRLAALTIRGSPKSKMHRISRLLPPSFSCRPYYPTNQRPSNGRKKINQDKIRCVFTSLVNKSFGLVWHFAFKYLIGISISTLKLLKVNFCFDSVFAICPSLIIFHFALPFHSHRRWL
jgi:hypothetical protein